jgi:hypothetical protein
VGLATVVCCWLRVSDLFVAVVAVAHGLVPAAWAADSQEGEACAAPGLAVLFAVCRLRALVVPSTAVGLGVVFAAAAAAAAVVVAAAAVAPVLVLAASIVGLLEGEGCVAAALAVLFGAVCCFASLRAAASV